MAARPCATCIEFMHKDTAESFGDILRDAKGVPMRRPPGVDPPCRWCPKIPPGEPANPDSAVELSPKNLAAALHYYGCEAVGWQVPDARDPIVQRNARVIAAIDRSRERQGIGAMMAPLAALLGLRSD